MNYNIGFNNHDNKIDFFDLLMTFLRKWKTIVIFIIICVIITGLIYLKKADNSGVTSYSLTDIENAKASLSDDQIDQVDYLYKQYKSYKAYRSSIQDYMVNSLYSTDELDNNIVKILLYYVESDIKNASQCFVKLALGISEYEQIAAILEKDKLVADDVFRRIDISDLNNTSTTNITNYNIQNDDNSNSTNSIIQVLIVVPSQEQADTIDEIINNAFENELKELKKIDSSANISLIDSQYSVNIGGFIQARQTTAINYVNTANNQLTLLNDNYIAKLSATEKAYYDTLQNYDEQESIVISKPSLVKYILMGIVLGLVLAVIWITFRYLFDGKIKTCNEITSRYDINVQDVIYRKNRKFQLFGWLIRKCKKIKLSEETVKQSIVFSDIAIKMKKLGIDSAFLIKDNTLVDNEVSDALKNVLKHDNIGLTEGNPLLSPEFLEMFSKAKGSLFLIKLRETEKVDLNKWMQLSKRYDIPVIGTILIDEC